MERKRAGFWIVLALINIVGLGYAIRLYARASSETRGFALFVMLLVIVVLGVADIRSTLPH